LGTFSMSRDGRRFAASVFTLQARLEKFDLDPETESVSGTPTLILPSLAAVPDLSPDGKWITYMRFEGQEDILVVKSDGTGLKQLTDDHYRDRFPTWSPSGDRIVFFSNRTGKYEIWTVRPDGSGLRQETDTAEDCVAPAWSPDGSRLSCTNNKGGNFIFKVRTEETGPRGLEEMDRLPPFGEEGRYFTASMWSADGTRIAGKVSNTSGECIGLAVLLLETGRYTSIIRFDPEPTSVWPSWLPDGRRLIYTRGNKLFVLDSQTGEERLVKTPKVEGREEVIYFPARDGQSMFRSIVNIDQDIWLIDLHP